MGIDYQPLQYEMPWRENFEKKAVAGWAVAAAASFATSAISSVPAGPFYWMAGICGVMALGRMPAARRLHNLQKNLSGRPLEFITLDKLKKKIPSDSGNVWLGSGYVWENRHAQRVYEILKRDWSSVTRPAKKKEGEEDPIGQPWIHGVEPKEGPVLQPLKHLEGHMLCVGTTGAGKTRLFDILVTQAILRGESVIIIDPKGDRELRDNARRACRSVGKEDQFLCFHPAFPRESVCIDPLANYTRVTELASRLAALIPSEGGGDPFKSFGWQALNNICQGLELIHSSPTLTLIRRSLEGGTAGLVIDSVKAYADSLNGNYESTMRRYIDKAKGPQKEKVAFMMMRFYYEELQPEYPSSELEGLLSMFQHDSTHFAKMVASLLPIMNMLTSGELGKLLSTKKDDPDETRKVIDTKQIINSGSVVYIGLDSLTDGMVGSAIGSLFLSDLTAVAGDRYNFGADNRPVSIFVDEAAEVINDPFIQLLNKGRGAGLRLMVATQTFADFAARMGSKDKALQVLGNINNLISLRVIDTETQAYVTENLPKTRLKYVMRTQGQNTHGEQPIFHGGNQGERLMEEEGELFPAQLLGMLPNLEYIAKISGGKVVKGRLPILIDETN